MDPRADTQTRVQFGAILGDIVSYQHAAVAITLVHILFVSGKQMAWEELGYTQVCRENIDGKGGHRHFQNIFLHSYNSYFSYLTLFYTVVFASRHRDRL